MGAATNAPRLVCVSAEKVFASLPQVERGVSKIIGGDPKGNNFIYTNGKCVILRNIDVSTPFPPTPQARVQILGATARLILLLLYPPLLPHSGLGRVRTPRPLSLGTTPRKPRRLFQPYLGPLLPLPGETEAWISLDLKYKGSGLGGSDTPGQLLLALGAVGDLGL